MGGVDQGSEGLLSSFLRSRRLRQARPLLRGRILDFGCGGGELAVGCDPADYLGYDRDSELLRRARADHPEFRFSDQLPTAGVFDTIAMLAVIEHLPAPSEVLASLTGLLAPEGRIVGTTPHPAFDRLHAAGARLGLFSSAASEEHELLLDRAALERVGRPAALALSRYQRFLLGANQLFVYAPRADAASE